MSPSSSPASAHLAQAAARLQDDSSGLPPTAYALRNEQARVFAAFAEYLAERTQRPAGNSGAFSRIILPPRTGKTVIAGHIAARTGLITTVVVPTRTLARQTQHLFQRMLPRTPVGVLTGDEKNVVEGGVNITTYSMLHRLGVAGLPSAIRHSALVFVDEAHRSMSPARLSLLREAFDPAALRVGLTATPDYDAERRLSRFFPELIHEVSLSEALELALLAPARVWVAEVDVAGSVVRMVAGDYERETLGRLMSAAPFFKATQLFRYEGVNASKGALLCCSTRQQAYDLHRFLEAHRPAGTPAPALVLGDTPAAVRDATLANFEGGAIDTLIQVGVLIEGWSSPRCKLLIDLAPSVSRVRAKQKYFRALTRDGDAEAHLYVILPTNLPVWPTLPMDLFAELGEDYECGTLVGTPRRATGSLRLLEEHTKTPVAGVRLRQRVALHASLKKPALRRGDAAQLRKVLASCPEFDAEDPCGRYRFCGLVFQGPLFAGRGASLLDWLGFPQSAAGYDAFLAVACPEAVATRLLLEAGPGEHGECNRWCSEEVGRVEEVLAGAARGATFAAALEAEAWLGAPRHARAAAADEARLSRERLASMEDALKTLTPRQLSIVERRFGLSGEVARSFSELTVEEEVGRGRIRQLELVALVRLRHALRRHKLPEETCLKNGRPLAEGFALKAWTYRPPDPRPSARERHLTAAVLAIVQAADFPVSPTEVSGLLGERAPAAWVGLRSLWRSGVVQRSSEGYWATPAVPHGVGSGEPK